MVVCLVEPFPAGAFGKVGAVYSRALLQKRLLVPVAMAATTSAWNFFDLPFDFQYGPMLLGGAGGWLKKKGFIRRRRRRTGVCTPRASCTVSAVSFYYIKHT